MTTFLKVCQIFRREFLAIGNIEVFVEAVTIASACNKVLRKRFLQPDTIAIIHPGGYTGNVNYSNKAMWLVHKEQTDGNIIQHARSGREFRLPELPHLSVDGYCAENRTVYEFLGSFWHGHTCLPFRDVPTMSGDTLSERCERPWLVWNSTGARYVVETIWECDFDDGILAKHPELQAHPLIEHGPLNTRDALYGGRTEAMRVHYKIRDGETIRYVDVMSLYPFICK
jgi:hypothetical protein